jgi:hypothetical protein
MIDLLLDLLASFARTMVGPSSTPGRPTFDALRPAAGALADPSASKGGL